MLGYFENPVFVFLLGRLRGMLKPGGQLVVGNFCATNPSKAYMDLFQWNLHHRSPHTLRSLAVGAGFAAKDVAVHREPSGVNLFLHAMVSL